MLQQLILVGCLTAVTIAYDAAPPQDTFILTAFMIGLLWIPLYATIAALAPREAILIRDMYGDWHPKGLSDAHAVIMTALIYCVSRDMDLAAEVAKNLATDFDIHLAPDTGISFLDTAMMCAASVVACEMGKKASFCMVPVLQWCQVLKWDETPVEQMEEAERRLDERSIREKRRGHW